MILFSLLKNSKSVVDERDHLSRAVTIYPRATPPPHDFVKAMQFFWNIDFLDLDFSDLNFQNINFSDLNFRDLDF